MKEEPRANWMSVLHVSKRSPWHCHRSFSSFCKNIKKLSPLLSRKGSGLSTRNKSLLLFFLFDLIDFGIYPSTGEWKIAVGRVLVQVPISDILINNLVWNKADLSGTKIKYL